MTPQSGLLLLGLVLGLGVVVSRRAQRGYIDFLTPMLAMCFLHFFSRGVFFLYGPEWLSLNPLVASAGEQEIAEALFLAAGSVAALILAYLGATRWAPASEPAVHQLASPALRVAVNLLSAGIACRLVLRLASDGLIALPDWTVNPLDTFGWAALAGVFFAGFGWGRALTATERRASAIVAIVGTVAIITVDARLAVSREATLQPIIAVVSGRMIGGGVSLGRIGVIAAIVVGPVFLWIGAMKIYRGYGIGEGPGYLESVPAVREYFGRGWADFVVGSIQDRFHALDSLIVCRAIVPASRPYEEGSLWSQVLISAFVPRAIFPEKRVGWGTRFATEFWGGSPESEGSYAVGIGHLGHFYVYDGDRGCLVGMGILGAGLGLLAHYLRRRSDALGIAIFVLVTLTICQIDRDLEVALGGVLKLLAILAALMILPRVGRHLGGAPFAPPPPYRRSRDAAGGLRNPI